MPRMSFEVYDFTAVQVLNYSIFTLLNLVEDIPNLTSSQSIRKF
jgi:hypothetical protein